MYPVAFRITSPLCAGSPAENARTRTTSTSAARLMIPYANRPAPNNTSTAMPAMIHTVAHRDGPSGFFLLRSIRRPLSSASMAVLDVAQRDEDLLFGRHPRGEQPADGSHDQRKGYSDRHGLRADAEIERDLAERREGHEPGCDVVKRQHQQTSQHSAKQRQQQRLEEEAGQDASPGEAQHAQRAYFLRAPRHRGIHGIHGGETRADRHND